jgi:sentrin-specific protease 1
MGKEKYAQLVTSQLLTELTDELSSEIAEESAIEELPNIIFNKIMNEIIDEEVENEKEFLDVTNKDEKTLQWALSNRNVKEVIVDKFNIDITRDKLRCLLPAEWLNDEVINFYFKMCTDREERYGGKYPRCHYFNTFFYAKLTQRGVYTYSTVRRWTKNVDLFALDKVIIPVHLGVHWVLSVINIRDQQFEYYDSMINGTVTAKEVIGMLRRYIEEEHMDKKKTPLDTSSWIVHIGNKFNTPQQANGFDCGMFTCKFANWVSQDKEFTFNQTHMPYFRKRMALEIKRGYVL